LVQGSTPWRPTQSDQEFYRPLDCLHRPPVAFLAAVPWRLATAGRRCGLPAARRQGTRGPH